jgi:hypothetical protein
MIMVSASGQIATCRVTNTFVPPPNTKAGSAMISHPNDALRSGRRDQCRAGEDVQRRDVAPVVGLVKRLC